MKFPFELSNIQSSGFTIIDGVIVLRNRILSALPGMGGRNSLQEKISECAFTVDIEKLQCPGDAL
ncbi:hypothetical protein ACSLPA_32735, partial [Escherichia coli]